MIRLDRTSRSIEALLGGAVAATQPEVVVSFKDHPNPSSREFLPGSKITQMNSATPVTIVSAPGNATLREVDFISIRNRDSGAVTVTIRLNDNGTTYRIATITLSTLEQLLYSMGRWCVLDSSGRMKT